MHGWIGGKHVYYVDFIGIFSLMGLGVKDFTLGRTILIAALSKMVKYEKTCAYNQHIFISFAFDTFGFLAQEIVKLLKKFQKVMHNLFIYLFIYLTLFILI
jgi:hypothetical protein